MASPNVRLVTEAALELFGQETSPERGTLSAGSALSSISQPGSYHLMLDGGYLDLPFELDGGASVAHLDTGHYSAAIQLLASSRQDGTVRVAIRERRTATTWSEWQELSTSPGIARTITDPAAWINDGEIAAVISEKHRALDFSAGTTGMSFYDETGGSTWVLDAVPGPFASGGQLRNTSTDRGIALWTDFGQFGDGEVLVRTEVSTLGPQSQCGAVLRAQPGIAQGYIAARRLQAGESVIRIMKYGDHTSSVLTGGEAEVDSITGPHYVRFRAEGSNLYAKCWPVGEPEPTDWQARATDESYVSGYPGVGKLAAGYQNRWNMIQVNSLGGAA